MKITLPIILILILVSTALAGGTSVPVEMVDIKQTATDQYILTIKTRDTKDYDYDHLPRNSKLTIYLRFDRLRYLTKRNLLDVEKYQKAITLLKAQVKDQGVVRFGQMGGGLCKVKDKANTYESDALAVYSEENDTTNDVTDVVYAYCQYK